MCFKWLKRQGLRPLRNSRSKIVEKVEKGKEKFENVQKFWPELVDIEKFWLQWDEEDTNNYPVIAGVKNDVFWKKTAQPGGYFTLENPKTDFVLTAVKSSLQIKGMF